MFRSLGLFSTSQCPDQSCNRPTCLFAHGSTSQIPLNPSTFRVTKRKEAGTSPSKASSGGNSEKKVRLESFRDGNLNHGTILEKTVDSKPTVESPKRPPVVEKPKPKPIVCVEQSVLAAVADISPKVRPQPPPGPVNVTKPPSLPTTTIKFSPQPYADRQKARTFTIFSDKPLSPAN